ncbi:MAG: TRAP transporter substrate-binding protein DctP [Elusimicrobiota bacterium]|jgi:tripartite ATP-independent transporter DctP family solute receptor|nr:TRAP transporter substrate-binding protein DctP [Elusimicrobiota bacterium]
MKKILVFAVAVAVSFMLVSCGGEKKSKTTIWKLAFNQSIENPQARGLQWLSDEFFKATNGAYRIEINANELLGDQKTAFESLQNGTIHMAMLGNPVVEAAAADFGLLALPGLYNSIEHQEAVFTSGILKGLFDSTKSKHFLTLAAVHGGIRNVYGKKPVRSPADLKGMKIRVMQSQTMIDVLNAMGATAVGMSQGEVYAAIQQGVLDGAENNEVTYNDLKQYEVAPVYSYTRHFMMPDLLVINSETYDSLSPEHKAIFDKLVVDAINRIFTLFQEQVGKAKIEAQNKGAKFIDDFDSGVFKKNFDGLTTKYIGNNAVRQDLYNKIKALAK